MIGHEILNAIVHTADEKVELNWDYDVGPGLWGDPAASSVFILSFLNTYRLDVYVFENKPEKQLYM